VCIEELHNLYAVLRLLLLGWSNYGNLNIRGMQYKLGEMRIAYKNFY
jgi:hypothetical protein